MQTYNPDYQPDYRHLLDCARNREAKQLPLYEHIICNEVMEEITGTRFAALAEGDYKDKVEYYRRCCDFWRRMGYDTISMERCIVTVITGGVALCGRMPGPIQTREDFEAYPWDELPEKFYAMNEEHFRALAEAMPAGMKAVGGVGNGVLETAEELVGYTPLCYMSADDPELYADLFRRIGDTLETVWNRFLHREYSDAFCVCRIGDDLGYKSNTLISTADIRGHIIPGYRRVINAVHRAGKPFLLHSCGCIFSVMDDLIAAGIDAKHSNEDQIAGFPYWVETYGDRIGNFGGIDTDCVCRLSKPELREYISDVVARCTGHGGFAFGSGNSIPDYVPAENFVAMNDIIRELRGEVRG